MGTKKNVTKLVCPNCGAEFEINEHECQVKNATVIGADSGLGTIYMKLKDRQEQLKTAGIDITKYFSMKTPSGEEKMMKWEGDIPVAVTADDPVLRAIFDAGTVPNHDLFRRWVMAQVFCGLVYEGYYGKGFVAWVHSKGYKYTWQMTEEELRVQAKLWKKDMENFRERNRWFNGDVVIAMIDDYLKKLQKAINEKKRNHLHKCKGVPYICVGGKNVFVDDIEVKVMNPLKQLRCKIALAVNDPDKLYRAFHLFNNKRIGMDWQTPCSARWIDAYKGAGAFYTMKNLILFHRCVMRDKRGRMLSKDASLQQLMTKAMEYSGEGWRLFGLMRKLITDNGINIKAKRAEWAETKALKRRCQG